MDINEMTHAQIVERLIALKSEVREMTEVEDVEAATEEKRQLLERKAELEGFESRKTAAASLETGKVEPARIVERGGTAKQTVELRNRPEYQKAFVKAVMTGKDEELRAFLTTEVSGEVPIPEVLDTEIRNAWEDCQIMSLVSKTYFKGILRIGFEYSATGAVVHVEGTEAPEEEELEWGFVEIKNESIKKWISVSDEAIENTTIDTLGEIYKEIAQRIVEKAEELVIAKIIASPTTSTKSAPGVPIFKADAPAVDTITMALAELSSRAQNITLAMNRRTYAALKAVAKKANYNMDVFDGAPVVFTDVLKASSAVEPGDTYIIAGDFGYGFRANFPNGNDVQLKVDDLSLAESDMVKIVGRQYVGLGVIAPKAFVKVVA